MKFEAMILPRIDWMLVSVALLDPYLMREMVLIFVLGVGKCATLAMSLCALIVSCMS